ncbi:MAG TPA: sigma-54 dependent transcriptional regulator [Vicinamibacterales bacterium]|nr:sigma-54 dependent transcriptional regulator [Vicinamibacterales bacterium]
MLLHFSAPPRLMSRVDCIVDRFVMTDRRHAIDLATGERVTMIVSCAGGHDEHARWVSRCDSLYRLSVCAGDTLVDFGVCGESHRFEAWRSADASTGSSVGAIDGIRHVERRIERGLAELFDGDRLMPRVVCIFGPPGSGKTRVLSRLARSARLQGFVPFAVDLLDSPLSTAIDGRSVCLIDDERASGVGALAGLTLRSTRPHVFLRASVDDMPGVANVGLAKLPARALMAAVVPNGRLPDAVLRRAAERADGNPARFIGLIHADSTRTRPDLRRRNVAGSSRAAEQAPAYSTPAPSTAGAWPVPGEISALRRQMQDGIRHLRDGRHAPGERHLRQAIGGLTRRGEWSESAEGSLALAASLLKRGRPQDAKAVVDAARDACTRSPGDRLVIVAATLSGTALTDLGRLEEAETVLAAAQAVGAQSDDGSALCPVALALARVRFWRGRYADAKDTLKHLGTVELDAASRVGVDVQRARIAVALEDIASAVAMSADAVGRADALARFDLAAVAACTAAFAHSAAGDLAAVRRDVAACAAASRATRDPLRRLRAELVLCEHLRGAGLLDEARRLFAPLRRMPSSALPRIVRARRDMLAELLTSGADPGAVVAREVASTGFHALALFVPKDARTSRLRSAQTPVEDAIEMLHACQTAADETATLTLVCGQAQRQTHAAAAAFFGVEAGGLARLASCGRLEPSIARRTIESGVAVTPHQIDERVEAAAPVKYGGAIIGALAMRWVVGTAVDAERVAAVTRMATAAAAPIVAAALSARRRAETAVFGELLGVSDAMIDVRRSVERAAAAPFAALIEGESGSGKELVARAIHKGGPRRDRPFVTLNCAAVPDDLVESEFFGHARGAFTGAVSERIGVFEEAHTGTLFLDEVGELSPRAQAKLLRVIQEGELRRIGENTSRRIDVRIVSATNRDLRAEAAAVRFRLDLLYRLDVLRIAVPPLRDRREDIPVLAEHLWRDAAARCSSAAILGPGVLAALAKYAWPGNVRELQNVLAALVVRAGRRGIVPASALPAMFGEPTVADVWKLDRARRVFDENFVRAALVRCGGRRSQAAAELGVTRQGLAKLMQRLGIRDGMSS